MKIDPGEVRSAACASHFAIFSVYYEKSKPSKTPAMKTFIKQYAQLIVAFFSFAAVIIAVSLQQAWTLYPCSLCISQRYTFLALGLVALSRFAAPSMDKWLRYVHVLVSWTGIGLAAKNCYVLIFPSVTCGRDAIADFINDLPMAEAWPAIFKATGMCSDPVPPVAGIPFQIGRAHV